AGGCHRLREPGPVGALCLRMRVCALRFPPVSRRESGSAEPVVHREHRGQQYQQCKHEVALEHRFPSLVMDVFAGGAESEVGEQFGQQRGRASLVAVDLAAAIAERLPHRLLPLRAKASRIEPQERAVEDLQATDPARIGTHACAPRRWSWAKATRRWSRAVSWARSEEHTSELQSR